MNVERTIREFIEGRLLNGRVLEPSASIWDQGVDSLGILRLVRFLETTFDVRVPHADVTPTAFGTTAAIAAYVNRRRKRPGSGQH